MNKTWCKLLGEEKNKSHKETYSKNETEQGKFWKGWSNQGCNEIKVTVKAAVSAYYRNSAVKNNKQYVDEKTVAERRVLSLLDAMHIYDGEK